MSHSYASSTQATEGAGAFVQQNPNGLTNAPMREFEIAAHQAALDGSVFHSYHKREASGYYARGERHTLSVSPFSEIFGGEEKTLTCLPPYVSSLMFDIDDLGALNAVDDQDSGQNSLQRRPSNSRKQVLVAGSSSTPGAAAMAASNQSFASMEMNGSTMSAVGNGSANQTVYGGSHRPGLRVNVPRTNTLAGQAVLGASGLGLIDASDGSLGLDTFLHPNTTPEATLERANGNDASHYPGALSPLSAFSPASGGPHSPSANQFPPSSPFPNSPHSPYPVSPEGHFSSGAISPALPLPAPSPVSLSPQFGPTGSNISPRLPMKPRSR
ncbi:hypothetical protein FRC15_007017 [Serendipita sp. 397]|nr:hypothetical protein FRC15_007017 [Serendipita sp. 397]